MQNPEQKDTLFKKDQYGRLVDQAGQVDLPNTPPEKGPSPSSSSSSSNVFLDFSRFYRRYSDEEEKGEEEDPNLARFWGGGSLEKDSQSSHVSDSDITPPRPGKQWKEEYSNQLAYFEDHPLQLPQLRRDPPVQGKVVVESSSDDEDVQATVQATPAVQPASTCTSLTIQDLMTPWKIPQTPAEVVTPPSCDDRGESSSRTRRLEFKD